MKNTFKEQYEVKLNYQKDDGFWVNGHVEIIFVECKHGVNEKNNHSEAEKIAKKRFPNCKIINVIYC